MKVECPNCSLPTTIEGGICTHCGEVIPMWAIDEIGVDRD